MRIDHRGKHEEGTGWGWSLRCAGLAGGAGDPDGVGDTEALAGHESSVGVWPGRAWQDEKLAMAQQGRYAETASPLFLSKNLGLHRGGELYEPVGMVVSALLALKPKTLRMNENSGAS